MTTLSLRPGGILFSVMMGCTLLSACSQPPSTSPSAPPSDAAPPSPVSAPAAARPPKIPIREFFDNPKISSAKLSPDAKRLAFLAPWENRMNVWVVDLDQNRPVEELMKEAKRVTADKRRGIFSYFWTRDGRYILYGQDQDGNENYHIYRVDPSQPDKAAVDLTPFEDARSGVLDLPKKTPGEILIVSNKRDKKVFDVYRLDLSSGDLKLVEQNPGDVDDWAVDTEGRVRAATAKVGTDTEIRVRDGESEPFRAIATYKDEEGPGIHGFSKDGNFLYFESSRDSDKSRLVKLDLSTGKETEVIAEDPEYDFGSVIISDKTDELIGVTFNRDRLTYRPFDAAFAKDLERLAKVHDGDIIITSSDANEDNMLVAYNSPTDPGATYLYNRAHGEARFLYRPRPWLKPEDLADMKPIKFKARDGLTIHGYLTVPKGVEPKNLPLILNVHGGPWARDTWGYDPEAQFLANRGYAVLQINFRGSTGYGKSFLEAGNKEWAGRMLDDKVDAVKWAIEQGIADPKRLTIFGGSYGGYATLAALAFRPEIFAAGVDMVGPSNLFTLMNTIPPYWETFRQSMYRRVGDPEKDKELLKKSSPLFSADKIRAPLFIAQGYNDPRVKVAESDQIVEALKKNGHPVDYMLVMDEGHGFANPENRMNFYERVERFLARHILGEAMPDDAPKAEASPEPASPSPEK
jgi:dipeptidyl aminopeptidase/acylaminoacyl peptidase